MFHARTRRSDAGFSLVEIVIAVVLVGVLSAVVVVGVGSLTSTGSAASCSASLDAARTALAVQITSTGSAPDGFDDLVGSGSLSIPAGVTVQAGGRAIGTGTWTLALNGTSLTCLSGPLWTPAQLGSGLAFWLDATTVGGNDGSPVGTWTSLATSSRSASQSTASFRPTLAVPGIGGLPSVRFDGGDDLLPFDGSFLVGTDFTVAAMTAREAAFGAGYYIGGSSSSSSGTSFILGYRNNTTVRYSHRHDGLDVAVAPFGTVTPTLHVATSDVSARRLWSDGAAAGSAPPLPLSVWLNAAIGRDSSGPFLGVVGEVVMATASLPTADRQKLEGYLAWKWGTVAALPVGHPYSAAPPTA